MATDPTTMTPVEIDTVHAANYNEQAKLDSWIRSAVKYIERLEAKLVKGTLTSWESQSLESDRNRLVESQEQLRQVIAAAAPYQVEYSRRPWNRYFLVDNTNGHVHRGMDCTTCFMSTRYSWLVDLADCDEDAMIEEWGEMACTVCFPSAPTNPNYNRPSRRDREAQAAREAEKAAKDAVKAEKAITDVDGSPLQVGYGVIKTKIAARNELSSAFQSLVCYGTDHPSDYVAQIRKLVAALDAAGVDWHKVPGNAIKKAVKDSTVPPNNPYRLTPEQITEHAAEIQANATQAEALAQEVIG
jgi:hypothetical protein